MTRANLDEIATQRALPVTIGHPAVKNGLLLVTPSLEVVALVSKEILARVYPRLRQLFALGDEPTLPRIRDVALVHDNESFTRDAETVDLQRFGDLLHSFQRAAARPVRQRATHLELSTFNCDGRNAADRIAIKQAVSMSLANNFFPDEWVPLAVRIDIADQHAWPNLTALRAELVMLFGPAFWSSTLGYRFRLNHEHLYSAGPEQAALGMRLMGVDWDDCLGQLTALSAYGLRSINWQTMVSDVAVMQWTQGKLGRLATRTGTVLGHRLWQTGAHPSIVDRNEGPVLELKEYCRIGKGLELICQHYDIEWFGEEVFERWSYRWNELSFS